LHFSHIKNGAPRLTGKRGIKNRLTYWSTLFWWISKWPHTGHDLACLSM